MLLISHSSVRKENLCFRDNTQAIITAIVCNAHPFPHSLLVLLTSLTLSRLWSVTGSSAVMLEKALLGLWMTYCACCRKVLVTMTVATSTRASSNDINERAILTSSAGSANRSRSKHRYSENLPPAMSRSTEERYTTFGSQ